MVFLTLPWMLCVYVCVHACVCDYCVSVYVAGDTGNPLANKWLSSENHQLLSVELDPLVKMAINQPDAIAPRYATNPLIQVHNAYIYVHMYVYVYVLQT